MSAPFNIQRLPFLDEELLNEHIDRLSRIPVGSHARSSLDLPDIPLPPLDPGSEEVSVTLVGGELPVTHIQDDYIPGGVRHVSMESQSFQANAFLRALELDDFRVLGSNHSSLSDFSDVNILGSDSDDEIDFSEYTDISRPAPQNPAGPGDIPPRSPSYPQDINQLVDLFLPLVDSVTEATQSLWTHRLFRHYLERWFPSDSELALIGHFCEPEQLPSAMVPALFRFGWLKGAMSNTARL